jgi:DNA-binding MarR family transcriptional regulator
MTKIKQSSTEEQKQELKTTKAALRPFLEMRGTMPLQYVTSFIEVALEEGLTVSEYANRVGISQSLMTRHLADLGEINRYHEAGLGLVEQVENVMDRRERRIRLTPKGRHVVYEVAAAQKR